MPVPDTGPLTETEGNLLMKAIIATLFASVFMLAACEDQGPMEEAGEEMDEAMDDATDG